MTTSAPAPVSVPAAPAPVPGRGLGIAGLVLAFIAPLIGLILSIIAKGQSNKVGAKNGPATAGIWVSIIVMLLALAIVGIAIAMSASAVNAAVEVCNQLGEGTWEVEGVTYTCG